jgi:hypothetical protein
MQASTGVESSTSWGFGWHLARLWKGDKGLAKTYWGYGFLGGLLWGIPLSLVVPGSGLAMTVVALFVIFLIVVNVGTWRSASQYKGPKIWSVLAKASVATPIACLIVGAIAAIVLPAMADRRSGAWQNGQTTAQQPSQAVDFEKGGYAPATGSQQRYLTDEEVGFPAKR